MRLRAVPFATLPSLALFSAIRAPVRARLNTPRIKYQRSSGHLSAGLQRLPIQTRFVEEFIAEDGGAR